MYFILSASNCYFFLISKTIRTINGATLKTVPMPDFIVWNIRVHCFERRAGSLLQTMPPTAG